MQSSSIAIPAMDAGSEEDTCQAQMLTDDEGHNPCHHFSVIDQTTCDLQSFNQSILENCEAFFYDTTVVMESFTTKFDLVCEKEHMQTIINAVLMSALAVGSEIGGRLSDRLGRKRSMFFSTLIIVPTTMFAGYSQSFWAYAILKFINVTARPCVWPGHCRFL